MRRSPRELLVIYWLFAGYLLVIFMSFTDECGLVGRGARAVAGNIVERPSRDAHP